MIVAQDIIYNLQDMTYLSWSKYRRSSGTAGSFLKSFATMDGKKIYYKLSNYDAYHGIIGHECINELIADRLLTILGIDHLHYQLIHALITIDGSDYETWLCGSEDYKKPGDSKVALDVYYQLERNADETPLNFCIRQGWADYIYKMLVTDFLILNRDRHGANMEVLKDKRTKSVRLAPLFDHGLSFFFSCTNDEQIESVNVMEDKPVQCFVGSHSARDNLALIPRSYSPELNALKESDRDFLFQGLESVISQAFCNKIWEMIWKRWKYYENFCNSR